MTEAEWLVCDEPDRMLKRARFRSYHRKSRLFAVACCRCIWDLLVDERSRKAVEVAERHADGVATDQELRLASEAAHRAHKEMFATVGKVGSCIEWAAAYAADLNPFHGAKNVSWMSATSRAYEVRQAPPNDWDGIRLIPCTVTKRAWLSSLGRGKWEIQQLPQAVPTGADKHSQAVLLRDLFGPLPFRAKTINPTWLAWNDGVVRRLAASVYDDRLLPSGHLDLARLAVLADALEEAGCQDLDILSHCRGEEPHTRGCWVVDLVLGKS